MKNTVTKIIEFAVKIKREYDSSYISAYSAKGAYFILLSAVPMALVAVMVIGFVQPLDILELGTFNDNIGVISVIENLLEEVYPKNAVPAISFTSVFILWSATKGIRSIAEGINVILPQKEKLGFAAKNLRAVVYTLAIYFAFVLSLSMLVFISPLEKLIANFMGDRAQVLLGVINFRNLIFFALLTFMFALAYRAFGQTESGFANQLYGGAFAALGWVVYSFSFSVYIKYFSSYPLVYGSFGGVMLFMLWLYMCVNILLCGALINKIRYYKM